MFKAVPRWLCKPRQLLLLLLLTLGVGLFVGVSRWRAAGRARERLEQGRAALEQGNLEQALAAFTEAVRLNPRSAEAYRERACLYQKQGRWEEAVADWTEALRLAPDAEAYAQRADAY